MSNRFFVCVGIAGLLGLVGMSLGCDKSLSAPTPPAAPTVAAVTVTLEGISLTASPSLVTSGGQLTMSWVAPSGRGCNGGGDWVALFRVGDPDITGAANGHSDLWFVHLCGATSGTSTLSAPPQPGQYEFRYMVGSTAVARSSPVTVSASASPLVLAPTLSVDGDSEQPSDWPDVLVQREWLYGGADGDTVHQSSGERVNGADTDVDL